MKPSSNGIVTIEEWLYQYLKMACLSLPHPICFEAIPKCQRALKNGFVPYCMLAFWLID